MRLLMLCFVMFALTIAAAAAEPPAGVAGRRHWAFQPVRNPPTPILKNAAWPKTSVDPFILAKLEEKELTPSPEADRRTLLRRVTFDLIGLPPTPEEIEAALGDPSPRWYEKVVDRLLASPHYGERWGRYWLDVARYADTKGYVFFEEASFPWAYTYRDYVIRALNDDLPYDQFLLQQLAADKLSHGDDKRPLTALGFLTLGGRFMNNQHDILDDRIDVVTRGLLGLTVGCARCHDHKFDPIPSRDYYALYGVFASCREPTLPPLFEPPPRTEVYFKFEKELQAREQKLADFVKAKHTELVTSARTRVAEYLLAAHALRDQPAIEDFMLIADGGDLNPQILSRWQAYLRRTAKEQRPALAAWHRFAALPAREFAARAREIAAQFVQNVDLSRPVNPLLAHSFANRPPQSLKEVALRYAELLNAADQNRQTSSSIEGKRTLSAAEEELLQVFYGPDAPPNVAMNPVGDLELLPDRPSQAKLQELRKAVETWRATGPGAPPRAMILEDLPTPYQPHVFVRGNPNNFGDAVPRQFVSVLAKGKPQPFVNGSGRLELARAIIDRANPLTARVFVNRVWLHHFGQGLVRTPSDFGLRSEPPSHAELLDHLATYFMDNGWSMKKLHRVIVLSAAYQQTSDDRHEGKRLDPENTLLWKMNRRRLDFEASRDALLAVAGTLNRMIGGPSIKDIVSPSATRRTLYGFLDRLNVPGLYRTFDFPNPDTTCPQRSQTTVAPQALFFLNHPLVQECARRVLQRPEIAGASGLDRRLELIYRLLYGRSASPRESQLARAFLANDSGSPRAWEQYTQALFLANEFVFID
jgi:hypothetical protein